MRAMRNYFKKNQNKNNEVDSSEVSYEFEFDIIEYPLTLIKTIKVIGTGTDQDTALLNAVEAAKPELGESQHLRYTQRSLKQNTEG